jgi:hypothetical protein
MEPKKKPKDAVDPKDQYPTHFSGQHITDVIRDKNNNIALYGAFLLLTLTKNLKLLYFNMDSLFYTSGDDQYQHEMHVYDKIYG